MNRHLVQQRGGVYLVLLGILLLAAILRLTRLDMSEFKSDEAGIARQALALVHEGRLSVVGPQSSQGPAHPPLQIYLLALPFAVTKDPRLTVAIVALVHTAAVVVTFFLGARFFHPRVGLIAAFLFAVNPWAIYYARKIWTQNWPLATALFIFSLLLLVVERRPWAFAGASLALVALLGTHLGGLAFLLMLLIILLLFPSRHAPRPLLAGSFVLLAFALPYLVHDATHAWANLRAFFDLGGAPATIDAQAARFAAWLASGYHYQDLAGSRFAQFLQGLPDLRWLDVVEMALLGIGVVYLVARLVRHMRAGRAVGEGAGRDLVLLTWLLLPVLLQARHSRPVYPHYLILLYPVQHLIIALLLHDGLVWLRGRLDGRLYRWPALGVVGLVVAIGLWQVYFGQAFLRFAAGHDTPGGYGPVVGPLWRAATLAGTAAGQAGAEVVVVALGDNPVWDNLPAALDVLLPRDIPHRFVDAGKALVFPMGPAVYLVTPDVDGAAAALGAGKGATLLNEVDAPGEGRFSVFFRDNKVRDDVLEGMARLEPAPRLDNGVQLLAYRIDAVTAGPEGRVLPLSLAWWYDHPAPPAVDYHAFAHLVDASGARWGQHDMSSFPSASWHPGDLVVTRFRVPVDPAAPPGPGWVRVGMYSYPDIQNAAVLDAAGNPATDAVVVGPVDW